MNATELARTVAQYMREQVAIIAPSLTKPDLRAAVAAADQWASDNANAYNSALPTPFRTTASAAEKAMLLAYVIMRRAGRLHAEEDG
jgi:3-methyladenine DNA glycosylase AlkC